MLDLTVTSISFCLVLCSEFCPKHDIFIICLTGCKTGFKEVLYEKKQDWIRCCLAAMGRAAASLYLMLIELSHMKKKQVLFKTGL